MIGIVHKLCHFHRNNFVRCYSRQAAAVLKYGLCVLRKAAMHNLDLLRARQKGVIITPVRPMSCVAKKFSAYLRGRYRMCHAYLLDRLLGRGIHQHGLHAKREMA